MSLENDVNASIAKTSEKMAQVVAMFLTETGVVLTAKTKARASGKWGPSAELVESIDYKVSSSSAPGQTGHIPNKGTTNNSRFKLPDPKTPGSMVFGAAAPYAKFVEMGTPGPYKMTVGNADPEAGSFRDKIGDWGAKKGLAEFEIQGIYEYILQHGTDPAPFMPTVQERETVEREAYKYAHNLMWKGDGKDLPTLTIKVEM